jgi:glycosyltransferase involved in cell wall biosynthesis
MPRITTIVCTFNRYDTLADTLDSLSRQDLPASDYEVLVVDNSTDIDAQTRFWRLTRLAPNARLILEATPGLSRARNIGMREAASPVVAYIDDDALPNPNWLRVLAELFETEPKAGIAGGPVEPIWVYPSERPAWLHPWQEGFLTIVDRGPERRVLGEHEWLAGTNIAYRREPLVEIGGFNEALGRIGGSLLSNEELMVSRSLEKQGYRAWYEPAAQVLHRVHANRVSQAWFRRRVSWQAVSDQMAQVPPGDDEALWTRIHDYQSKLPPHMRGLRGLFLDTPDPNLFQKQCDAIGALLLLLMASGNDPDPV